MYMFVYMFVSLYIIYIYDNILTPAIMNWIFKVSKERVTRGKLPSCLGIWKVSKSGSSRSDDSVVYFVPYITYDRAQVIQTSQCKCAGEN